MRHHTAPIALILAAVMLAACARSTTLERLTRLQERGIMSGHQDDTFYGLTWNARAGDSTSSDIKLVCGDYPAVMGFELGGLELGQERNLDSVPFRLMRREILAHTRRGGFVTISWHPYNIVTNGNAWDNSDTTVVARILPGGTHHAQFITWLDRIADFLNTVSQTPDGVKATLVFRPWHENNGGWFWWGRDTCTPEQYLQLWNMTQDYLTDEKGLDNLIWSYSPNLDGNMTMQDFLRWYPGDQRVQLIGLDAYQNGSREDYQRDLNANLDLLCRYAAGHHRLFALTECGMRSVPQDDWWTGSLYPCLAGRQISYFLAWRNNDQSERFAPSPGSNDAPDFRALTTKSDILMLNDIK